MTNPRLLYYIVKIRSNINNSIYYDFSVMSVTVYDEDIHIIKPKIENSPNFVEWAKEPNKSKILNEIFKTL